MLLKLPICRVVSVYPHSYAGQLWRSQGVACKIKGADKGHLRQNCKEIKGTMGPLARTAGIIGTKGQGDLASRDR